MKPRLVLWGNDAQNDRVLIALELRPEDNKVNVYTFPENVVTEDFHQKMMDEWRDGKPVDFPEGYAMTERELSVTDSLIPEELKVERGDVVQRAQTEWHFMVLSSKLNESYSSELAALKDRVDVIESYDGSLWDELKGFWDKVQSQVRERNLLKSHSDTLRDSINELFDRMKKLRSRLDEEFDRVSKDNYDSFINAISNIEKKITDGLRLAPLFDELKDMQRRFRDAKLSRDHRAKVWEKLDAAFKAVKEKRFGPETGGGDDKSPLDRLNRRYEGLLAAIEKMERSIQRDQDDLDFQSRKIEKTDGQLEAQIRQAKIKMIEERIRSKDEKLNEMTSTRAELEQRMEQQRKKQSERDKIEEAKKAAQEKIAQDMKARGETVDPEKVKRALEAVKNERPDRAEISSLEKLEDAVENAIDTAKAIGTVATENLGDFLVAALDSAKDFVETAEEKFEEAVEKVEDYFENKEEEVHTELVAEAPEEEVANEEAPNIVSTATEDEKETAEENKV